MLNGPMAMQRSHQGATICRGPPSPPPLSLLLLLLASAETVASGQLRSEGRADDTVTLCRANLHYLPPQLFAKHTCALCYNFHPGFYQRTKWSLTWRPARVGNNTYMYHVLQNNSRNGVVEADHLRPDPDLLSTFPQQRDVDKWADCCQTATNCCRKMRDTTATTSDTGWCPPTWDGWQCWEAARPDSTATAVCPSYVYFDNTPHCDYYATKQCESNGRWFTMLNKLNQTREWSDYGSCTQLAAMLRRLYVHVSAYAVSIAALLPALIIFFSYRQLRVHRISIHKQFFISLLLNSVMVIVFKCVVILDELRGTGPSIAKENGVGCKVLFIITKYCRLTNYLWQFCESFYLHKLIASAFAEQKSLLVFYLIGWVFPVIPVAVYAALRARFADQQCWVLPVDAYEWVLNAPCLLSLLMCTLFLINIIRVLVTKLRAQHANEPSQYRRAVRATLVLVPLFGLHLMVTIYRPAHGACIWMQIYYYGDYLLDGLQGAMVALIFCYLNGEVQNLLRRSYGRHLNLHPTSFRTGHRSSSLSGRSQNTMHTLVGLENTTSAALEQVGSPGAAPLLHRASSATSQEVRL